MFVTDPSRPAREQSTTPKQREKIRSSIFKKLSFSLKPIGGGNAHILSSPIPEGSTAGAVQDALCVGASQIFCNIKELEGEIAIIDPSAQALSNLKEAGIELDEAALNRLEKLDREAGITQR